MAEQRKIRRYTAYFRGWAQAFGEHEGVEDSDQEHYWVISANQVGLILTPTLKRVLFREFLGKEGSPPEIRLDGTELRVGEHLYNTRLVAPRAMQAISELLTHPGDLHLYLTYHLFYQSGTRILTLSKVQPLIIIYKEIEPFLMQVSLEGGSA